MIEHSGNLHVTRTGDREISMSRVFDAPRGMVFDAYTKPDLVRQWLGVFGGWTFEVCEIDLRVGGKYRYFWRNVNGGTLGVRGEYREVVRPERLAHSETFDPPFDAGEARVSTTFAEQGGKTTLTTTVLSPSKEALEGMVKNGMTDGVTVSYDKLEALLAKQPMPSHT